MSQIDWNEVREYYLSCRSYKLAGERFGLTIAQVKNRAIRGKWKSDTSEVSVSGKVDTSKVSNPLARDSSGVSNPATCDASGVSNQVERDTSDTSKVPSEVSKSVPSEHSSENISAAFPGLVFPMLPNAVSQEISTGQPWAAQVIPHDKLPDKAAYRAYITNPGTSDCLFSGIRGQVPTARVSRENIPAAWVAIVADYDKVMTPAERAKKTSKLSVKPTFVAKSYSGGTHAVWVLARPIPLLPNPEMVRALQKIVARELRLNNAYGAIDMKAFSNPAQYYHAGWNWQIVDPTPIPEETTLLWFQDALRKSNFSSQGVTIPLERVREEMAKRGWDKRWSGEFELGSRGVRFWDDMADCQTAAIVTETGMVCFTGGFPFRSWEDIFGHEFIAQYQADTIGKALCDCYFVNNSFYVRMTYKCEDGSSVPGWQCLNRQNFELFAAGKYSVSSKAAYPGEESPLKQLMTAIIEVNSIPAATPFIYRKETVVTIKGEPRLNTSLLRVHEPDLTKGKSWGDGFPWIASFMERLFPDIIQRERFMAAWAYTYRHAYLGTPKNGHTIFIAGGVGSGKNFLSECLYGISMGGYTDASDYVLGQTRFNDHLMSCGVWTLNDTVAKGDARERNIFVKALKRMSANQLHVFEGKFKKAAEIYWQGRIIVTLNTDPDSLQLLPSIEISNRDKISFFKTSDEPMKDADGVAKANAEMGALCSFLLNWEIPEHCQGDARWGVKNYLHPELLAEAADSGSTSSFREILTLYVKSCFDADKRLESLEGSATWFLQQMMMVDGINDILRGEINASSFGKRMSALASSGSFPLEYKRKTKERVWHISRKAFMEYLETPNQEGEIDDFYPF